jgi:hypothetical protein
MATSVPVLIGAEHAAFLCGAVGISAATCRPGGLPNIARGTGCRVSGDRRALTLLLAATPGAALLDDIRRTGSIAVVFSQPSTHRTLQLKGSDARIVPLESDDGDVADRYVAAFVAHLAALGYPHVPFQALLTREADDLAAIQFTIEAVFSQTPGPRAGEALSGPA